MPSTLPRNLALLLISCFIASTIGAAAAAEPAWDLKALHEAPATYPADEFKAEGVRALFYEGLPYKGQPTRLFAWYGAPPTKAGAKLPAMVLVHGGGGTAFERWVKLWNERGYAAIAMDLCGCVPKGSYGKWQRHERGGPPGWGGFDQIDNPPQDQWTYHAVAGAMLAHSLIRSFPEIDNTRIGVTGISWGGYLTSILSGVDQRFRFAVPVYGCGFLGDNSTWLPTFEKMGKEKADRWLAWWDPSAYLSKTTMPILWVTGTNDFAYPMDSLQKSYRLVQGTHALAIRVRMPHGHGKAGENPEEIHAFAEQTLKGGTPLPCYVKQGSEGKVAWATFESKTPIKQAELLYTADVGKWQQRKWESCPARFDAATGRAEAELPAGTKVYYFNVTDQRDLIASSDHIELQQH